MQADSRPWLWRAGVLSLALLAQPATAEVEGGRVRIGVLNDQSGLYSESSGRGSVVAAQLAAEDMAASLPGVRIEVINADHQNKPDVGSAIARRWYDQEGVDAIADVPVSSVALAVQGVARERSRIVLNEAATSDLSGAACSPTGTQWGSDTYMLSAGTAGAVVRQGQDTWFFLTADYAFGQALLRDASASVQAGGGRVLGNALHPLNTTDFSSLLLQAQSSGAKVVGLADAGGDLINAIKQANEFGLIQAGQRLVGFLVFITDVHALGLDVSKGILVTDSAYWDRDETTRAFTKRFQARHGKVPSAEQAGVYASVLHYLKGVREAGSKDAAAVMAAMRRLPVDFLGRPATIREDGRVVFDLTLYEVKAPNESRYPWDYYRKVADIPAASAFRPLAQSDCPLIRR